MKVKSLLLFLLFSSSILFSNAQNHDDDSHSRGMARFKQQRAAFLKKELNLTDAEAAAFTPVDNELMDKRYEMNKSTRELYRSFRQKTTKTDADYQKLIDLSIDNRIKEAQLQKEYYQKFKAIIPLEKLYRYQRVEKNFMRKALEEHRAKRKREGGKGSK